MIRDKSSSKVLAKEVVFAKSMSLKTIGFMFQKKSDKGIVFIFNKEKKLSFHTFFMRFDLDFIFLDSKKKVLSVIRNVKPWNLFVVGKGKYIVEVPAGKASAVKVGDKITFK